MSQTNSEFLFNLAQNGQLDMLTRLRLIEIAYELQFIEQSTEEN